ncbi:hypothetical protein [Pleomorphovibrio marinus]|uniref:hypothetical protein n=1 Tax=Pleomorphovibrio marinus TaxID=2164132 RepID=UPI00130035F5|nr:hypothetical protein [Pleomorphovibrio marinus]
MLSFFKFNDPIRLVGIILLLLLLRLPYMWMGTPVTQPEMLWLLVGERISEGFMLYTDIRDNTAPLSALIYGGLHFIFGRTLWPYHLLASFIIFLQSAYINSLFLSHKSYDENTYLPAFITVLLFHFSYDLLTLSPVLLGSTFLLLAIGQLFSLATINQNNTEAIVLLGLFAGLAPCFHFPLLFFLPVMILTGLFISNFNFQELLLSIVGYFLPLSIIGLFFFWNGAFMDFVQGLMSPGWKLDSLAHVSYRELLYVMAFPIGFTVFGYLATSLWGRLYIHQQKQKQIVMIYGLGAVLLVFLNYRVIAYQFIPFIPLMVFFINHLILRNERLFVQSVLFYALLISVPFFGYSWFFYKKNDKSFSDYALKIEEKHAIGNGSKLLVLGKDLAYYHSASPATGFLNFNLSKKHLLEVEDFDKMHVTMANFQKDPPEWVIDQEGVFSSILPYYPILQEAYTPRRPGIYELKKGSQFP